MDSSIKTASASAEKENSLLLSFSNDLASVRSQDELKVVIQHYFYTHFELKEYIITLSNDDGLTYRHFLHDLQEAPPQDEGFRIITGPGMPRDGAMTGAVLLSDEPVIFDIADVKKGKYSFPSESFWRKAGATQIRGMRLKVAGEDIGIIWTQPGRINNQLLMGLSAQIAVAISNVLAYEKIEKQLEKITYYKQQLEEEKTYLQQEIQSKYSFENIIGNGPEMQKVFYLLSQVAATDSTVLILGETGTGKELIARAIHNRSLREKGLMVKVDCAALPLQLAESELFGHEKGSFTDAHERHIGKFEIADNGTLFLDEIGELPPELQVKLLRAIQEKEIERIGGKSPIKTNVRIIAATNRNLQREVEDGRFRLDLFYRLNVFSITLPPLRERKGDIPELTAYYLAQFSRKTGKNIQHVSGSVMKQLMNYPWPGNVREFEHLLERTVLITTGNVIRQVHLPKPGQRLMKSMAESEQLKTLEDNEKDHIIRVLNKCNGKISGPGGAAGILGIPASTLNSRIKKLGIKKDKLYT